MEPTTLFLNSKHPPRLPLLLPLLFAGSLPQLWVGRQTRELQLGDQKDLNDGCSSFSN